MKCLSILVAVGTLCGGCAKPGYLGDRGRDVGDVFTVGANLAGLCGISLPCGFADDRLPIGLQILGKPWDEARILTIASAYQQACGWVDRRPPL